MPRPTSRDVLHLHPNDHPLSSDLAEPYPVPRACEAAVIRGDRDVGLGVVGIPANESRGPVLAFGNPAETQKSHSLLVAPFKWRRPVFVLLRSPDNRSCPPDHLEGFHVLL